MENIETVNMEGETKENRETVSKKISEAEYKQKFNELMEQYNNSNDLREHLKIQNRIRELQMNHIGSIEGLVQEDKSNIWQKAQDSAGFKKSGDKNNPEKHTVNRY